MARAPRIDVGGHVYHVINRANGRATIFSSDEDYKDFEYLLSEIKETFEMRILAYVVMPNHWHLLLYPKKDGDLAKSMQWLTTSHARRHHTRKRTIGGGHLYQDRYKSFLVEDDAHLLTVLKYIERNPIRAQLANNTKGWRWGSGYRRTVGSGEEKQFIAEPPTLLPTDYEQWVNTPELAEELKDIRYSITKGVPYGEVSIAQDISPQFPVS